MELSSRANGRDGGDAAGLARPSIGSVPAPKQSSLVSRFASDRVLWAAWSRVAAGSGVPGVDGVATEQFARRVDTSLTELAGLLRSRSYRPQPLRHLVVTRDGKERNLAIPTVRDRVVQRAFLEVLGKRLDHQLAEASFAYRKGRSWLDALSKVEQARAQGLRSVFRADVANFFDEIDHEMLRRLLTPIIGDTYVAEVVLGWVSAPVVGPNGLIERARGLPQGAPVSPALANHFLAGFDKSIDGRRGRLVRYADDMAVFCADDDTAQSIRWDVERGLAELRLRLNGTKSYASSFERGFSFLGWVFFRDGGYEESPSGRWVHPMSVGRTHGRTHSRW